MNENFKRTRDAIDKIRTIYWFEGIRISAGVLTAYAVERLVEPEGFKLNKAGAAFHRNKWISYRSGLHTPRAALVTRANQLVAGSDKELNHVLWKVLDDSSNVVRDGTTWLRQLAPGLQPVIFSEDGELHPHRGQRFLSKIERRASLDSLACLTILLKMDLALGVYEQVWRLAGSIFRVLLMLGEHFTKRGLAEAIFEVYVEKIFHFSKWNGERFYIEKYDFSFWAGLLYQTAVRGVSDKGRTSSWSEKVHQMNRILDGKIGLDLKFSLDPLTGPDIDLGPLSEATQRNLNTSIIIKKRCIERIYPGNSFEV